VVYKRDEIQIRKPSWWIVLADDKSNRVVVPPMKIADIPLFDPSTDRNYRAFKVQFQGPPTTGLFTWRVYIVSDTFVGEEVSADMTVRHSSLHRFRPCIIMCVRVAQS
jgi:translocation protein SEC63